MAVFLDRDNTLIHNDGDLGDPSALTLMQGAAMGVASLCGLGFKVIVVTNQGGVARGKYTEDDVKRTHDRLAEIVADAATGARIDAFYYCPYHPQGKVAQYTMEHPTRKPQPGMLLDAARDHGLDLPRSWMVGDQMRDVQAGAAAGCRTILLRADADRLSVLPESSGLLIEAGGDGVKPDFICKTLVEAVRIIASQRHTIDEARAATAALGVAGPGKRFDAAAMARLQQPRPTQTDAATDQDATPRKPVKPFRPMTLPPVEDDEQATHDADDTAEEAARVISAEPTPSARERIAQVIANARAAREAKPTPSATTNAIPSTPAPTPQLARSQDAAQDDHEDDDSDEDPQDEPRHASAKAPRDDSSRQLRLILQELRSQRGTTDQTSPATLVAMIVQVIVGVCLLGGLWMGAGNDGLFLRWMLVGLLLQGTTVAILLFARRS